MRRWLMLAAVACTGAGCTPVRSTLPPPYLIDGRSYSADEMDQYASASCATGAGALPPNKFTTDGCSAYRDAGWRACCIKHDVAYWCGAGLRRAADLAFRRCVREASSAVNAGLMYGGVRLGGGRFMPFPWRFGYGHPWPHRPPAPSPSNDVASSEAGPQTPPTSP
jgi:hypothetical protein